MQIHAGRRVAIAGLALLLAGAATRASAPMMQPGPEQKRLARVVGKWNAVQRTYTTPGQPPEVSQGVAEVRNICRGMWIDTTYRAGGFEGHGLDGYDPIKKKYVGTWVDNMRPGMSQYEGVRDASGNLTATMSGPDVAGKMSNMTIREVWKDDDTREWSLYSGPRAEGQPMMQILYTRVGSKHAKKS